MSRPSFLFCVVRGLGIRFWGDVAYLTFALKGNVPKEDFGNCIPFGSARAVIV